MGSNVTLNRLLGMLLSSTAIATASPAFAQDTSDDAAVASESAADASADIIVTGSRFGGRSVTESPTPIDAISAEQLTTGGGNDLQSMIEVAIPSFSTPRPSAAGTSDYLQSPTLRGLSTGQILVLVNGKRRHTNSALNTNNQIGRGDVAYDFGAIPSSAIKSIEVLRDGAAAQYGSDAIGGVVNVILRDDPGYLASGKIGSTTHGDGEHYELNLGAGLPLGDGGVIRMTGQYIDHHRTDRAEPDTRQQYFGIGANGQPVAISGNYGSGTGLTPSNGTLDPREATFDRDIWVFGEPEYTNKALFLNAKLPLGDSAELYGFAGYNKLKGLSFNFLRRSGQNETVRGIFPDGYLPKSNVVLENYAGAFGVRADVAGFALDLSSTYGQSYSSQADFNTNNVSLGLDSPTSFFRGSDKFEQWTTNLDLARDIDLLADAPLQIAFGAEFRKEWYALGAGDPASYANGGIRILDGPNAGALAPVGSQPTPGLPPASAISGDREAKAVYVEVSQKFFDRLLLDGAVRYEDYSDFGSTTNFKLASHLEIADWLALRASYGTGFRAPALAQIFYNSSTTNFLNGQPVSIRLVSVADPLADLVGAPDLKPEKSRNLSVGTVLTLPSLTVTLDYYRIELEDRLALSGTFSGNALINYLTSNGYPNISAVSFVTNGIDTTTQGFDLTATWRKELSPADTLSVTLAANYNKSRIDEVLGTPAPLAAIGITTPLIDLTQQVRLTKSTPREKIALNMNWQHDRLTTNLTLTRYGKVSQVALTNMSQARVDALLLPGYDVTLVPAATAGNSDIIQHFSADIIADLEVSYDVTDEFKLSVGASNLFDKFPDRQIASTVATVAAGTNGADNNGIFPYAYIAPYGTSGRFVYARAKFEF